MSYEIKRKIGTFLVHSEEEAKAAGIAYKPWRECEPGDWGLTDDGFVAECLRKRAWGDKDTAVMLVFSCGRFWLNPKTRFNFLTRWKNQQFTQASDRSWAEIELGRERVKRTVRAYATMRLNGQQPDWGVLGRLYRPDQRIPEATVRRLFRMEQTKALVRQEISTILAEKGITEEFAIDYLARALKVAEKNKSAKDMIQGYKELKELLELGPQKARITEEVSQDTFRTMLEGINAERQHITATRTAEVPLGPAREAAGRAELLDDRAVQSSGDTSVPQEVRPADGEEVGGLPS